MNDQQAIERYRYMLRTAPPDDIERAHEEAFQRSSTTTPAPMRQRPILTLPTPMSRVMATSMAATWAVAISEETSVAATSDRPMRFRAALR
jgi:hypothetical protein